MVFRRVACFLVLGCSAMAALPAHAGTRAVLELFTSQGCSSCPPADELAGQLVNDRSLIVMSLAVDYWDYIGWKDTLAIKGHSNRQRAYARARGDGKVYTPQMVVNGLAHAVGSDRAAIDHAIAKTRQIARPLTLPVTMQAAGKEIVITLPAAIDGRTSGEVWLCPITRSVSVAIGRGENRGRSVTYHNVVRRWIKLADWTGEAQTLTVPIESFQTGDIDEVAVVLQSGVAANPGVMLGAFSVSLR